MSSIKTNKTTQLTKLVLLEASSFSDLSKHIGKIDYSCEIRYTVTHNKEEAGKPRPTSKLGQIRLAITMLQEAERELKKGNWDIAQKKINQNRN